MSLDKSNNDWEWVKAKDFMLFNPRESVKKGTVVKNVPMDKIEPKTKEIPSYELTEYKGGVKFRNGDTLMARITPCLENGKISQVSILDYNEIGAGSTEFIVLREKEGVSDKDFIYYLSNSEYFKEPAIKSMVGSSGRQRVQRDVVENLDIFVPPLDTQKKIGKLLSLFDKKITLNKKINKNLLKISNKIYEEWFLNFEFPNNENKPYKTNEGSFKDTEFGIIPDGWGIGALDDLIEFKNGHSFKSGDLLKKEESDCYAIFKMGNIIKGGGFNPSATKSWIKKSEAPSLEKYLIKKGDLLMCMTDMKGNVALLGHTALMDTNNRYLLNQRVGLLRVQNDIEIDYPYLYLLTNHNVFLTNLRGRANSGVQVNLSTKEIKESKVIIPPKIINQKFNNIVKPIFDIIFNNNLEIQNLTKLRDTLLPKLMSGEIDVSKINCDLDDSISG